MTTIAWPSGFAPNTMRFTQKTNNLQFVSTFTGATEPRALAPARWMVNITLPPMRDNREFSAFLMKLRGGLNSFTVYDFTRRAPVGTMRGTLTLNASASVGAESLSITGGVSQAGKTLVAGDWLSVGSQLFMVVANATADGAGVITASVEPPVRTALSSGASVTWDKPTATYRAVQDHGFDTLNAGFVGGMTIDALEVI